MSSVAVPVSSLPRPSAAELRRMVEAELAERVPGALSPHERVAPEMASSGIAALDALTGGWPRGTLTELFGPASSGRTSVLVAALAAATALGEACALIDAGDAFDPESAAGAGVDLKNLLWVRCGKNPTGTSPRTHEGTKKTPNAFGTIPIPRSNFVSSCLRGESIPTPEPRDIGIWGYGDTETMERINPALARKPTHSPQRRRGAENDSFNRSHPERGGRGQGSLPYRDSASFSIPRFSDSPITRSDCASSCVRGEKKHRAAYARIEQALKAADLLLGAGGFGLVVIDLAGLPPEAARRVPLTTWFRFRRAVETTSTVLLLISPQPITQSCAALSLRLQPSAISKQQTAKIKLPVASCQSPEISDSPDVPIAGYPDQPFGSSEIRQFGSPPHAAVFTGFRLRAEVIRSPLPGRKRPHSAHAEIATEARWA